MKIEEVKLAQEKLKEIEVKSINVKKIEIFLESVKDYKNLNIGTPSRTLMGSGTETFGFIGKEIIELLEAKKTILEKEIHNFTLDQLLPEKEIEDLGIKFKASDMSSVDDKTYYYKVKDGVAIISWFNDGVLGSNNLFTVQECNESFSDGFWTKI